MASSSIVSHPLAPADEDLLRGVARGEMAAVGVLYDRHATALMGRALRIVRDRAAAEDIVHDAFILVADRAPRYDARRGSVSAWLNIVVRNLALDHARRERRRSRIERSVIKFEPATPSMAPDEVLASAVDVAKVRSALDSLSSRHREVLETAFLNGMSYPEIAMLERVPVATVKSRAHRALASLRAQIPPMMTK